MELPVRTERNGKGMKFGRLDEELREGGAGGYALAGGEHEEGGELLIAPEFHHPARPISLDYGSYDSSPWN